MKNELDKDTLKVSENQDISEKNNDKKASEVSINTGYREFDGKAVRIILKDKDPYFKVNDIKKDFKDWCFSDLEKHMGTVEAVRITEEYQKTSQHCVLVQDYEKYLRKLIKQQSFKSFFKGSTLDETIQKGLDAPPMKNLFSNFLSEGELAICFADNGVGKSILSIQIAEGVAKNKSILNLSNESSRNLKSLYYDFELNERTFKNRYTHKDTGRTFLGFGNNLVRQELDMEQVVYDEHFTDNFIQSIENDIMNHHAEFIVIDNIKAISVKSSSDTNVAILVMRKLNELKNKLGITILVIGHSTKTYGTRPIIKDDLKGAKELTDFADSVFTIGKSAKNPRLRYIKHLKCRNSEMIYHFDNVVTCEVIQEDNGYLKFDFVSFDSENSHLIRKEDKEEMKDLAKQMINKGSSLREVAKNTGMSKSWAEKVKNEMN